MALNHKTEVCFPSGNDNICGTIFIPESHKPAPALVICHGALDFKENYYELCRHLADKGTASLAIDMHGHGSSGGRRLNVNIDEWVMDIRSAIDYLEKIPQIDNKAIGVFGLSSGGTAVLEAALVDSRIRCVIALDATVRNTLNPLEYLGMKLLGFIGLIKLLITEDDLRISMVGPFKKVEAASDPEVNRRWKENPRVLKMWSEFPVPGATPSLIVDTIKRVNRIKCPTLVIHGEEDKVDPVKSSLMLFRELSCTKSLHIVPGNGHLGHMDRNKNIVMELASNWAKTHLV